MSLIILKNCQRANSRELREAVLVLENRTVIEDDEEPLNKIFALPDHLSLFLRLA